MSRRIEQPARVQNEYRVKLTTCPTLPSPSSRLVALSSLIIRDLIASKVSADVARLHRMSQMQENRANRVILTQYQDINGVIFKQYLYCKNK